MKNLIDSLKNNRFLNNFIVLLTGEGVVSLIGMVSMMIIIKAIGLEFNGMILSIQTYCLLLNNIFGFKSFQALIKYISLSFEHNDNNKVKDYIFQSYVLDIIAVILATIFSFVFLNLYGRFMDWNSQMIFYAKIFIWASIFQIQGTPIGILRTFNKFNYITYSNVLVAVIRLVLYLLGIIFGLEFNYYFYIEVLLFILPNIQINYLAYKTLKEKKLNDFYKRKLKIEKGFFMFNFYSNISSTIDIPVGTLTTVIINKYLGYSQISIYKVFEKIGSIIGKLGSPLSQIIYPEMNERIAKKNYKSAKRMNDKLMYSIFTLGIVITVIAYFTHELWLGLFIPNYEEYVFSLMFYLIFVVFVNGTVGVHSLFMALNYIKYNIPILLGVNSIYLVVIYFLVIYWGLNGVILALTLQAFVVVLIKLIIMRKNNYTEKL
ncbi:oligosaccharide flippase family protein [Clostridium perfringens]|nr:oligosaccharide flippase family protein [Clostridium perfringens]